MLNRTTTFALAAITTIATAALAPTGASAHFSGGNFGGGFAGPSVAHVPSTAPTLTVPAATGGHSIPRSSIIARLPVGSTKKGGHRIPTTTDIPKFFPVAPNPIQDPKHVPPKPVWNGPIGIPVVDSGGCPDRGDGRWQSRRRGRRSGRVDGASQLQLPDQARPAGRQRVVPGHLPEAERIRHAG